MTVLFPRSRTRSRTAVVMHGAIDPMAPPDEQDVLVEVASIADCWFLAVIVFFRFGSHTTMSASAPTRIAPFFG